MTSTQQIVLPEAFRLKEINMPIELASVLAGRTVDVEFLPEEPPKHMETSNFGLALVGIRGRQHSGPRAEGCRSCLVSAIPLRFILDTQTSG
jgi:hypothetical protein